MMISRAADGANAADEEFCEPDVVEAAVGECKPQSASPAVDAVPPPRLVSEAPRPRVPRALAEEPGIRRIRRLLAGSNPVTWVFTGDELTQGGAQSARRRNFTEIFAERVRGELRRYLDVAINTGIAGDRAVQLARNLEGRVLRFRPDVVSITLGLNDSTRGPAGRAEFGERLAEILAEVKSEGAVPVLHVPGRFPVGRSADHADLPAYVELLRSAAKDAEAPLLDHWTDWRSQPQGRSWLAEDGIRPNDEGHRAMARLLFAALGVYDVRSPCCE